MNTKQWTLLAGIVLALIAIVVVAPATFAQLESETPRSEQAFAAPRDGGPCDDGPRDGGPHHGLLDVAAETLGITREELVAQLDDDTSIADVAAAQGVPAEEIVNAVVAQAEERLQQAVEAGRLTQDEANERLTQLRENVTTRINEPGLPERPPHDGGPRGGGPGGGGDRPLPTPPADVNNT